MNKRYLLMAGDDYYPRIGDSDWIECFETKELAESQIIIDNSQSNWGGGKFIIKGIREWTK